MMSTLTLVAQLWITDPTSASNSPSPSQLLARTEPLPPPSPGSPAAPGTQAFVVNPAKTFQTIDGFGASMTDASAYVLMKLPQADRDKVMELFFGKDGLRISLLRQPMGASDFAKSVYSYDDLPAGQTDPELKKFSLDREREAILPLLKQAKALNPELRFMGSPWSPPAWMKTGGTMLGQFGGVLKPEFYQSYAQYFVKFIQGYAAEGLPVRWVTPQNEMDYGPLAYPGMKWSIDEEATFVREALGPALEKAQLDTKILVYDHNWDKPEFPEAMLDDPDTAKYIAGTAWHYYGGSSKVMETFAAEYPDKGQWFTEGGSGKWIAGDKFAGQFADGIQHAVNICSFGGKSFIWWNLALDQINGPIVYPNTANYGLIKVNTSNKTVATPYRAGFYTLGHFSKFVQPGAVRVEVSGDRSEVIAVAFRNPDGKLVAVFANLTAASVPVTVAQGEGGFSLTLPGQGAATAVWKP
ncbi:MAG: glycoside hydrolase family 30 beta sandwich domain-containing protein [Spirochaetales bacterium]